MKRPAAAPVGAAVLAASLCVLIVPTALASGTVADMVLQPGDLPGTTVGLSARVLDLAAFEGALNPTDAAARKVGARVLRRAGFRNGSVANYLGSNPGAVSSFVVKVQPKSATAVARWEVASSPHDPHLTFATTPLAGFTNGRMVTARSRKTKAILGRFVVFSRGSYVSAIVIVNGTVAPSREVAIALARRSQSHIAANA